MNDTPHFGLPLALGPQGVVNNQQDTLDDIAACIVAILSTPLGWRDELPTFGVPDFTFRRRPINPEEILSIIGSQEPRAILLAESHPSQFDALMEIVSIGVSQQAQGTSI
jgi:phage baseplate assembly protein W